MSFRRVILIISLTLTTLLSLNLPSCDAYSYAILSQTLPQRSYYIETSLTSSQLSPLATGLSLTSNAQINVNASLTNDLTVNTQGTGLFAIIYRDINSDSYCVIRVLDAKSTTIQQSGLACTLAPSVGSARVQAEPSTVTCGGLNPCKQSVVTKLDIDTAANNNNIQQTQDSDNMGASSTTIIIASVSGAVGLVGLVIVLAMVCHSRRQQRYTHMKDAAKPATTTSVMWATPPAIMAASTEQRVRGESTHVRTQTELNYAVNPMQYNVAVDIHEPGLQLSPPTHRYH